jgi:phosphatidylglycerophosphate synthase
MAQKPEGIASRRPIASRETKWASAVARWLAARRIRPNLISLFSVIFGTCSGACFVATAFFDSTDFRVLFYFLAAVFIQLRLLCNLFDGMVAVEGGFRTKSGEVFNDCPDRIADPLILIGAGYAASDVSFLTTMGWAAALSAVITAYIRVLGVSCGTKQYFAGPMAKQHRMAVMTVAALVGAIETLMHWPARGMAVVLGVIILGCIITIIRRLKMIINELESK